MSQKSQTAWKQMEEFYHLPVLILIPGTSGELEIVAGDPSLFSWNENEQSVAHWVLDKAQMAGAGGNTLTRCDRAVSSL